MKRVASLVVVLALTALAPPAGAVDPCVVNGSGSTVLLPPVGCAYLSPMQVHVIMDGLPAGTDIQLAPIHKDFICGKGGCPSPQNGSPTVEQSLTTIEFRLTGTGVAAGLDCSVVFTGVPLTTQTDARADVTAPVQTFGTEIQSLDTNAPTASFEDGCHLFSSLRARAGSASGAPALPASLGTTTVTKQLDGTWEVASCFDVNYQLEWTIEPGVPFVGGLSGTQDGIAHMCAQEAPANTFGGDNAGFVPPNKTILKCETLVGKAAGKLGAALYGCHATTAGNQLKLKPYDEEACEAKAIAKFTTLAAKVAALCPPCLDAGVVAAAIEAENDTTENATIFCDSTSGVPLGDGDDAGWVPADKVALKCETGVARNVGKAENDIAKCHAKMATARATGKLFDEEACEEKALAKLAARNAKYVGCPACLTAVLAGLPAATEARLDAALGTIYCASPSGAFLDPSL